MDQILDRLIRAIQAKDIEAFGHLYTESAIMHEPMLDEPAQGRDQIMSEEAKLMAAFSDLDIQVRKVLSSDGHLVAEVVMSAVNDGPLDLGESQLPPTGNRIEVPMVWALDIDNQTGLISEERDYFDPGVVMRQLGVA